MWRMMKKNKKPWLYPFLILGIIVLTVGVVRPLVKRYQFFQGTQTVKSASANQQDAQMLSEQIGVRLDPNVEKHAALLRRRGDIVLSRNAVKDGFLSPANGEQDTGAVPEQPVWVYTGTQETDTFCLNFAFIDGLEEPGVVHMVWQVEWKKNPFLTKQRVIQLQCDSMLSRFDTSENSLLLYYGEPDCWVEKPMQAAQKYSVQYYPDLIGPLRSHSSFGTNRVLQVWGRYVTGNRETDDSMLYRMSFAMMKKFGAGMVYDYVVEWWSADLSRL